MNMNQKESSTMNAQEIIEYIRTSEKKTPGKVYVWEKTARGIPRL